MLLVVVLLGVIAVAALPNFSRSHVKFQIQDTIRNVSYLMRYAQSRAIAKHTRLRLLVDPEARLLRVFEEPPSFAQSAIEDNEAAEEDLSGEPSWKQIPGRWGRPLRIPREITLQAAADEIVFYPDGTMDKTRIYLCRRDTCATIATDQQRGEIRTFDFKLELE